jgi:DNA-binding transcriptional ArsR family regulator
MFQALGDPTRRAIVERLCRGPASVSQLAESHPMSLSGVLQHLQLLEASGLIRSQKVGRVRTYRIEAQGIGTVDRWISDRRSNWEQSLDRLGEYLATTEPLQEGASDA